VFQVHAPKYRKFEPSIRNITKMADGALSNCVGDGDKQQSNADMENITQYVII